MADGPRSVRVTRSTTAPVRALASALATVCLVAGAVSARAEELPPAPAAHFNDYAGLVSVDQARRLDEKLRKFEEETSTQVVVAVFPLAYVDLSTGEVSRMVGGFWPKTEVMQKHPISGQAVEGFRLPGWSRILEACRQGGAVFPLMKIQHWDIALTDQGPLLLELNDIGGTEIAQVHGYGLLTEEVREFLKRHANTQAHPWVRAL